MDITYESTPVPSSSPSPISTPFFDSEPATSESEEIENTMDLETSERPVELSPTAAKIADLRKADKDFDTLVSEIDTAIENSISKINNSKSFNPVPASSCLLKVYVTAIPFTAEEKANLLNYLREKYISPSKIDGHKFKITKCRFSNRYQITTERCYW